MRERIEICSPLAGRRRQPARAPTIFPPQRASRFVGDSQSAAIVIQSLWIFCRKPRCRSSVNNSSVDNSPDNNDCSAQQ